MRRFHMVLTVCAAALALALGIGLNGIRDLSVSLVERVFPVAHDVVLSRPADGQAPLLRDVPVRFDGRDVLIETGDDTLRLLLDDLVLTCADPAARQLNALRAAALALLLSLLASAAAMLPLGLLLRAATPARTRRRAARRPAVPVNATRRSAPIYPSAA